MSSTQVKETNCCDTTTNARTVKYRPATDVVEFADYYEMMVDIPGVDREHLELTLEKGVLTIEGTAEYQVPEGYQPLHNPPAVRRYVRSFQLSDEIDQQQIDAEVKNGVVRIKLPKSAPAKKTKLVVK